MAGALDVRSPDEKTRSVPAFGGAVAVNAASKESATGLAFAASLRLPVLFVDRDGVPAPTTEAITAMNIQNTWVIGGPESIADSALARLPGAKRLGGADVAATSAAVINELRSRGLPVNVAYMADESRPVDAAIAATAVARVGGFLLLTPGGDAGAADPSALITASAILAAAGIFFLDRAAKKNRDRKGDAPAVVTSGPTRAGTDKHA